MSIGEKKKRLRGSNFSEMEKRLFIDIISRDYYKNIIESKRTDGNMIRQKEFSWEKIALEYNSNYLVNKRSIKQLKSFYDNIKRVTKKLMTDGKIELTGGGLFKPNVNDATSNVLNIKQEQIVPLTKVYDCHIEPQDDVTKLPLLHLTTNKKFVLSLRKTFKKNFNFGNNNTTMVVEVDPESIDVVKDSELQFSERYMRSDLKDNHNNKTQSIIRNKDIFACDDLLDTTSNSSQQSNTNTQISMNCQTDPGVNFTSHVNNSQHWTNRNYTKLEKMENVKAYQNVDELAHLRKEICEIEKTHIKEKYAKEFEILEIKKETEILKRKCVLAKLAYYETKRLKLDTM